MGFVRQCTPAGSGRDHDQPKAPVKVDDLWIRANDIGDALVVRRVIMTIAASVSDYLSHEGIRYDLLTHSNTQDSAHTAQTAHIPGDQLAKCVVLEDENGYLMAVLPASHRLDLRAVRDELNRPVELASEHELVALFSDCEPGAIPPLAPAYGIEAVVDQSLGDLPDVYFEGGDHVSLVHVSGRDFLKLMSDAPHRYISHHL
jgi:Ala-tRNA(Pro) deacylase